MDDHRINENAPEMEKLLAAVPDEIYTTHLWVRDICTAANKALAENAALKAENENLLAAGKFISFQADKYLKEVESLKEQVAQLQDSSIDRLMALTDEQVTALTRLEGSNPDDAERIAKQAMELAMLNVELATLQSKSAALVDALKFYADESRYNGPNQSQRTNDKYTEAAGLEAYRLDVTRDGGVIAGKALAAFKGEKR